MFDREKLQQEDCLPHEAGWLPCIFAPQTPLEMVNLGAKKHWIGATSFATSECPSISIDYVMVMPAVHLYVWIPNNKNGLRVSFAQPRAAQYILQFEHAPCHLQHGKLSKSFPGFKKRFQFTFLSMIKSLLGRWVLYYSRHPLSEVLGILQKPTHSHQHKSESSNEALTKAEASKGVGLFSRKEWSSERLKVSRTFSILESLSLKASRLSMILYCFFLLEDLWKMSDVSNCSGAQQRSERCRFQGFPILRTNVYNLCYLIYSVTGIAWNSGGFHFLFGRELSGLSIGFPRPKKCCEIATNKLMPRLYFCIYMHYFLAVALGKRHDIATIHVIKIVNSPGSISLLVSLSLGSQWLRKILTWKQKDMQHAR